MSRQREELTGFSGPMRSTKTLFEVHHVNAAEAIGQEVVVFKPLVDTRYGNEIRSRSGGAHPAIAVATSYEILDYYQHHPNVSLIAIDEAQFFDPDLPDVILDLTHQGVEVVYTGLNMNFRGEPWPIMTRLMPITQNLHVLTARCMAPYNNGGHRQRLCGAPATMTQRLINNQPASYNSPEVLIEVPGTAVTYEARCLDHWSVPDMPTRRLRRSTSVHTS